ncbi:HNH endonuclease [Arthrobacter jiangjiafuii]|uniref:HNH endonuclease n=1 Tax=Arthrobacter jiangjiafuii TaxID=2817475 RepID=A0A975M695_9MICC|nr:HNH endonuclease signature motif containing protein [Arthrobacter jiangjiafuii]MBP3044751.1 DUF222 domain-containing protein [Arthrobacter jiangjiafuii]QWC10419.1 HNH endonuclease [Arthrobacter jiangjiafuii]
MTAAVGVDAPTGPDSSGAPPWEGSSADRADPTDFLGSVTELGEALDILRPDALSAAALMSTGAAAILAAEVEAISRTVEYLQIVCAGALETHRVASSLGVTRAAALVPDVADLPGSDPVAAGTAEFAAGKVHAEFRSTADYLRSRLRIGRGEAQRRLNLASALLPSSTATGQPLPPALPALGGELASGTISSAAAAVISDAVEQIRHRTDAETAGVVEADLAALAAHQDRDFLLQVARRWVLLANQDDAEPSEEELRRFQGIFPGRKKNGLNHLKIYCTDDQHETLLTVMNAAAGPRIQDRAASAADGDGAEGSGGVPENVNAEPPHAEGIDGTPADPGTVSRLDQRSRPQRLLGGLVDAAKAALAAGGVPAAGGLRPQVMVTIDAASLLKSLDYGSALKSTADLDRVEWVRGKGAGASGATDPVPGFSLGSGSPGAGSLSSGSFGAGAFAFAGPVATATVRRIACDADLLPVVLSGEGRILDVGREQRLFPPHLRKALHARDQGCAFPGCSIPGPWTEAHHIDFWSRGGPTSTDNGVLLCSHHHHEIHKENWLIKMQSGIPWFVPPAYVDPDRVPLRNLYFRGLVGSGSILTGEGLAS